MSAGGNSMEIRIVMVNADDLRKIIREEVIAALASERAALALSRRPSLWRRIWRMWGAF